MTELFCERSIELHKEYLRQNKLKYSILEKSIKGIKNLNVREILKQNLKSQDKRDAVELLGEVLAHEIFFESFADEAYPPCPLADRNYGSCAGLLNEIYRQAMALPYGFVGVGVSSGNIYVLGAERCSELFVKRTPILTVDVCEHVYFMDYGFDKSRYLLAALPRLRLGKLTELG